MDTAIHLAAKLIAAMATAEPDERVVTWPFFTDGPAYDEEMRARVRDLLRCSDAAVSVPQTGWIALDVDAASLPESVN